MSSLNIVLNS